MSSRSGGGPEAAGPPFWGAKDRILLTEVWIYEVVELPQLESEFADPVDWAFDE
jgi:hypothetical protein